MTRQALHIKFMDEQAEQRRKQLLAKYELIFGGYEGRVVLADILRDLGLLQSLDPRDPVPNALRNYAEAVLAEKVGRQNYMAAVGILLTDDPE